MANKIDNVIDAIETALAALVTAGTLKTVKREVLLPFAEHNPPVLGLAASALHRETTTWIAEVLITMVTHKGSTSADQTCTELVATIDAAIMAVNGEGKGGIIDQPRWEFWYDVHKSGEPLQHVGAVASVRIRCQDPLAIAE